MMTSDTRLPEHKAAIVLPPLPEPGEMPEWVPVLEAGDMTTQQFHCGTKHCALGWSLVLGIPNEKFGDAYRKANTCHRVSGYNDHACITDAERAEAFNKATAALGIPQRTREEVGDE